MIWATAIRRSSSVQSTAVNNTGLLSGSLISIERWRITRLDQRVDPQHHPAAVKRLNGGCFGAKGRLFFFFIKKKNAASPRQRANRGSFFTPSIDQADAVRRISRTLETMAGSLNRLLGFLRR